MDTQSSVYAFCIIRADEPHTFGMETLNGNEASVYTICYKDVGIVVTRVYGEVYPKRSNLLAHQRVVARVFEEFTVVPFSFGNVFPEEKDISLLAKRLYDDFDRLLRVLDNKIEVEIKVTGQQEWLDSEAAGYPELKELVSKIKTQDDGAAMYDRIRLGQLAQQLFSSLQEKLSVEVHEPLAKMSDQARLNKVAGERVLFNAAYLIDKGNEAAFDAKVNDVYEKWRDRVEMSYSGPWPPYNFANIEIKADDEP